jgi:rhamnulokinase
VPTFAAVDLGATSGRVVNVHIDRDAIDLDVVRRFPTRTIAGPGGALAWDFDALLADVRSGLVEAADRAPLASVAVDAWGVDYGLLDGTGRRVGPVHAYRSSRTDGVMDDVVTRIGRERIYRITGVQFLPFNTVYQLAAARETADYRAASRLLMVPDLINHALCGSTTNDVTDASTSQLLDTSERDWSDELVDALGLRRDVLPELHEPGTELGSVRGIDPRVDGLPVAAIASHDTASAVAGIPLGEPDVYISCGTWALVGCELPAPITTRRALAANVTNELGAGGTVRLLKNVTGLWLLEECRRQWAANGTEATVAELVSAAEDVPGGRSVINPDDPRFTAPGDMPARIAAACAESGQPVPSSPPELTRVILDSLALAWRATVRTIERVRGTRAERVHLVGGGSAIPLLWRLCASACGRPVLAGPVEATVAGNAIVQAVASGELDDIAAGRRLVDRALPATAVRPDPMLDWDELASRLAGSRPGGSPA